MGNRAVGAGLALVLAFFSSGTLSGRASGPWRLGPIVRVSQLGPYGECGPLSSPLGIAYPGAEAEPAVAVNPATIGTEHVELMGVWQQDRWSNGGARGITGATSFDGGGTWKPFPLPFTHCAEGGLPFDRASDPWVSIGPDGTAYAAGVGIVTYPDGALSLHGPLTAVSHDAGQHWVNAQVLSGPAGEGPSVTDDPAQPGVAYLTWTATDTKDGGVRTLLSLTSDGGRSWSGARDMIPARLIKKGFAGVRLLVDSRAHALDELVKREQVPKPKRICRRVNGRKQCRVEAEKPSDEKVTLAWTRSSNGGKSWSAPTTMTRVALPRPAPVTMRATYWLDAAADQRNEHVYVVWRDGRFAHGRYGGLAVVSSSDSGRHWSSPLDVPIPAGTSPSTPSIAVDGGGRLGITYYALPEAASAVRDPRLHLWFVGSEDGGRHFSAPVHVGPQFSLAGAPRVGADAKHSVYFLGDYQGLAAAGSDFYPFFIMANPPDPNNRTDVFAARLSR